MTQPIKHHLTKIVATVGPASESIEMIGALFEAGVNCFRLNFSHGNHGSHRKVIENIRKIEKKTDTPIGIIADLQGPKLRVGKIAHDGVELVAGHKFELRLSGGTGDTDGCVLPHKEIFSSVRKGALLLLNDGRLRLEVESVTTNRILTKVLIGGFLSSNKGVNIPELNLSMSSLTAKDEVDLEFAIKNGADWVALSFVRSAADILKVREIVGDKTRLIAKIEKPQAIKNLSEILQVSDAIMIARGDLGVEIGEDKIPSLQKKIVQECREMSRPVIVATQMLESMTSSPTPTRAELSDVATALYDGADAVMLSAESASGKYPIEAVNYMCSIICRTEEDEAYKKVLDKSLELEKDPSESIVVAARHVADVLSASCIVAFSKTGNTTLRASRLRPKCPLLGLTPLSKTARMTSLFWGVRSIKTADLTSLDDMTISATATARKFGFAKDGDSIIVTAGFPLGVPGRTNILRLAVVGEHNR